MNKKVNSIENLRFLLLVIFIDFDLLSLFSLFYGATDKSTTIYDFNFPTKKGKRPWQGQTRKWSAAFFKAIKTVVIDRQHCCFSCYSYLCCYCFWPSFSEQSSRCQFHQHFISAFLVRKCFAQLFSSYVLALAKVQKHFFSKNSFFLMKLTTGKPISQ